MSANEQPTRPMATGRLILATLGVAALAAIIVLGAILPAEFNQDPLGVGKLSGLSRLWAPDEIQLDDRTSSQPLAREYERDYRSDVIEIPLGVAGGESDPYEVEYKVAMKKGATLIYAWDSIGANPNEITFDFHGHTVSDDPNPKMTVATWRQARGARQRGALVAPFDGIQGWYFKNTGLKPVVIRVRMSGFYDLVPAGRPGNEFRIEANLPAANVHPKWPL